MQGKRADEDGGSGKRIAAAVHAGGKREADDADIAAKNALDENAAIGGRQMPPQAGTDGIEGKNSEPARADEAPGGER